MQLGDTPPSAVSNHGSVSYFCVTSGAPMVFSGCPFSQPALLVMVEGLSCRAVCFYRSAYSPSNADCFTCVQMVFSSEDSAFGVSPTRSCRHQSHSISFDSGGGSALMRTPVSFQLAWLSGFPCRACVWRCQALFVSFVVYFCANAAQQSSSQGLGRTHHPSVAMGRKGKKTLTEAVELSATAEDDEERPPVELSATAAPPDVRWVTERARRLQPGYERAREGLPPPGSSADVPRLNEPSETSRMTEYEAHRKGVGLNVPCFNPVRNTTMVEGRPIQVDDHEVGEFKFMSC